MDLTAVGMVAAIVALIGLGFLVSQALLKLQHIGILHRQPKIFQLLPDAVIGVAASGTVRSLNKAAEALFGREQDEVRGQPLAAMIRGATTFRRGLPHRNGSSSVSLDSNSGIETEAIRKDGTTFPVRCVPLGRSFLLVTDHSDRVRFIELERRFEFLTAALQKLPAAMMVVNREGRVLMFNRACEAVIGPSLAVGMDVFDVFPGVDCGPPFEHRSGYIFSAPNNNPSDVDWVVLSGVPNHIRRCEDLLTQVNGFSEPLLESVPRPHPIRKDLERLQTASAEAVTVFRDFGIANRR